MVILNELIARLDVLVSFVVLVISVLILFVRLSLLFKGSGNIKLIDVRYFCLEMQEDIFFILNDIIFEKDKQMFYIIIGLNMGGKFIYIRLVGVVVFFVQIGFYVLCSEVQVIIVDSILARVGVGDNQVKGIFIFMVEMLETVLILKLAIENFFMIIDEFGRGILIYDGFGLVWVIFEYIVIKIKGFCFFVIYFYELIIFVDKILIVNNLYVIVLILNDILIFFYRVK